MKAVREQGQRLTLRFSHATIDLKKDGGGKMQIAAQIIGYIAVAENLLIYLSNRRDRILLFKFISDALWLINYLLIGGFTGAVLNIVAMTREAVFSVRDRFKWAGSKWIPVLFLLLTWISPVMEWISAGRFTWLPVLPAFGSMILLFGFYIRNTMLCKVTSLFGNGLWLTYAALLSNWAGVVGNILLLVSAVIGIIHERTEETMPGDKDRKTGGADDSRSFDESGEGS